MTIEERLDQLEKRNKRLTAALTLMAVAICAVVMVAATGRKVSEFDIGRFDLLIAKTIVVTNDARQEIVQMYADEDGNGVVGVYNRKGGGAELKPGP